jgi:osmotically-inducible protein OsmY
MTKPNNLLEADVREELAWNPALNSRRITVTASDGEIVLRGAVDTFAEVELAGLDAWAVSGVTAVDNELLVGLAGAIVADGDIAAECAAVITNLKLVPDGAVSAVANDGWVTLSGEVRHHYQRRAAQDAVGRVTGVVGVTDRIALTSGPVPSDVAMRIKRALDRKAVISGSRIEVSNLGRTVYLEGATGSRAAMDAALHAAWSAPGITNVVNHLAIRPEAAMEVSKNPRL